MRPRIIRKPWGTCEKWKSHSFLQVDVIKPVKGGHSSVHLHEKKINVFYVHSGCLEVRLYADGTTQMRHGRVTKVFNLTPGMVAHVIPNIWHDFLALSDDTIVTEMYLRRGGIPVDFDDIVRSDNTPVGGVKEG